MKEIKAVIFDYGLTIGAEYYFNIPHPKINNWYNIVQNVAFNNKEFNHDWMLGLKSINDIAKLISIETNIHEVEIIHYLKIGCESIKENLEVINFAKKLKSQNFPIAMVTINFDIFDEIIIPNHDYNKIFDVIINSSNYNTIDKKVLWKMAFDKLKYKKYYENCLLIEDLAYEINRFKEMGGDTIIYSNETNFAEELKKFNFINN